MKMLQFQSGIQDTGNYAKLDIIKTKRIDSLIFAPDDTKPAFNSHNTEIEETILLSYPGDGDTISAIDAHSFSVKTWNVSTGELIHTFTPPSSPDYREAINLSNSVLAIFKQTDVANNTVELWNLSTGEQLQTLKGVNDYMYPRLTYSPDRKLVVIGYSSGKTFYCSNTGNPLYVYDKVVNWIKFSFSPDGNHLAIGDNYGRIVIWDVSRIVQEPSCFL
jgi:WD40 repeat protein